MRNLPRIRDSEHLWNWRLCLYSFFFLGILEVGGAFLHFSYYMSASGFSYHPGSWILQYNEMPNSVDFARTLSAAQSVFFVTLIMMQIGHMWSSYTRHSVLFPWCARKCMEGREAMADAAAAAAVGAPSAGGVTTSSISGDDVLGDDEDVDDPRYKQGTSGLAPCVRSHSGPLVATFGAVAVALIVTECAFIQNPFITLPIPSMNWLIAAGIGAAFFIVLEFRKLLVICRPYSPFARLCYY